MDGEKRGDRDDILVVDVFDLRNQEADAISSKVAAAVDMYLSVHQEPMMRVLDGKDLRLASNKQPRLRIFSMSSCCHPSCSRPCVLCEVGSSYMAETAADASSIAAW